MCDAISMTRRTSLKMNRVYLKKIPPSEWRSIISIRKEKITERILPEGLPELMENCTLVWLAQDQSRGLFSLLRTS